MKKSFHVLYLITANTYGGAEHSVYKLVNTLDRARFSPVVACLGNNSTFIHRIQSCGVRIYPLHMKNVFDIRVIPRLYLILKRQKIDILHTQLFKSDFYGRLTGKIAGTPVIISTIQNMESFRSSKFLNLLDRLTGHFTYKIISVSESVRDFTMSKTGLPRKKFTTIYNFVDIDDYHPSHFSSARREAMKRAFGLESSTFVIGTIGRLAPQKAQKDFLRAAKNVWKKFPLIRFIIAGNGPLRDDLKKLARELSLEDKVIFTGFIGNIRKIFSLLDIFVLTSHWEGLPLTICEAMASFVPVVSTNVGGVPELIEDRVTGILTSPGNIGQIEDALSSLISDRNLRLRLTKAARRRVEEAFSLTTIRTQIEKLYLEGVN